MQVQPAQVAAPRHFALRMRTFFAGYFVFGGVSTPFFPVWLQSRGLTAVEIAACIALPALVRVLLTPFAGWFADRAPHRRFAAISFTVPATLIFLLAWRAKGYWPILLVTGTAFTLWALALPAAEALALTGMRRFRLDYGRMRVAGSIAFIITNLGAGALLSVLDAGIIFWLILAALVSGTAVAFTLPVTPPAERAIDDRRRPGLPDPRRLLAHAAFLTLILVGGLIQASHAVLYSFGSIYWTAHGYSGLDIGFFWAMGACCEILVFSMSGTAIRTVGPFGLLAIGGLAAILRWTVFGLDPGYPGFAALQTLHGLTFGATYLGNQHAIARAIPEERTASAQGLLAMISGLILAGTTFLAGPLYAALGGRAFLVMAVFPALALVLLAVYRIAALRAGQPHSSGSGGKMRLPS